MMRHRFTVRRLMILVAISAVAFWFYIGARRAIGYHRMARHNAYLEEYVIESKNEYEKRARSLKDPDQIIWHQRFIFVAGRQIIYYKALKKKYQNALLWPWKTVPPDPPDTSYADWDNLHPDHPE